MNMVLGYCTAVYFKIKMVSYLNKKFVHSLLNIISEYLFPVLRAPDQMIFSFINRMTRPFNIHAEYFIWKAPFPQAL